MYWMIKVEEFVGYLWVVGFVFSFCEVSGVVLFFVLVFIFVWCGFDESGFGEYGFCVCCFEEYGFGGVMKGMVLVRNL